MTKVTKNHEKKVHEKFGGKEKSIYLCTRFREASEFPTPQKPRRAKREGMTLTPSEPRGKATENGSEKQNCKKNEEKFAGFKFSSYLCKVFPPHGSRKANGTENPQRTLKDLQ
ncbi:MAG: hypothetical protein HDS77_00450 [Bacteroidales bacterium]|nr:hypothetical protein [Bacteroidales bacterium]